MHNIPDDVCCKCGRKESTGILRRVHLQEVDGHLYCQACLAKKVRDSDPARHCSICQCELTTRTGSVSLGGKQYCKACARKVIQKVILTTTSAIEGYVVQDYHGLESVEFCIGSGLFTEVGGEWADFWGVRSEGFENKLHEARMTAERLLKIAALNRGGNAVVGVDMDYTELSRNRVVLILNGTVVRVARQPTEPESASS